jgi:pSer/pThr/pTyr-binding forkhead associated (FHA) protein
MSSLTLTLLRFGFLLALWIFIAVIISVLRRDLLLQNSSAPAYRLQGQQSRKERRALNRAERERPRRLVLLKGPDGGKVIDLINDIVSLGRAEDSDLVLSDEYCSNRHARFVRRADGRWIVEDMGSTNGTFLNDRKVTGPTVVSIADVVRVGRTEMELRR